MSFGNLLESTFLEFKSNIQCDNVLICCDKVHDMRLHHSSIKPLMSKDL